MTYDQLGNPFVNDSGNSTLRSSYSLLTRPVCPHETARIAYHVMAYYKLKVQA